MRAVHHLAAGAVVTAAALALSASAFGGSPGPMVRGDDGSLHTNVSAEGATLLVHRRSWSLDGGPFKTHQRVTLARSSTLAVIDGHVVETAGIRVTLRHVGDSTFVAFGKPGVYRFRTGALTLTVTVSR